MKIQKNNHKKVIILIAGLALLLTIFGLSVFWLSHKPAKNSNTPNRNTSINYEKPTDQEKQAGDAVKKNTLSNSSSDKSKSMSSNQSTNSSSKSEGTTLTITAAYKSGSDVRIQTLISAITSTGSCSLKASNSTGLTYSTIVGVQALPSSSTCKGFTVPLSKLSSGNWIFKVTFTDSSLTSSDTKEISL